MTKGSAADQRGFTLIELAVVVLVVGILVGIGLPLYLRQADQARDTETKATLRNALLIEELYHLDNGVYTQNRRQLEDFDNSISWNVNGDPAGTVRVRVRAAQATREVCVFGYSESGVLYAIYHAAGETRYGEPDQVRACNPNNARDWSTEPW